jgi:hypothetical protein
MTPHSRTSALARAFAIAATALLLAAGGAAFGQSGGIYDLRWNTFDGGGAMGLAGGAYALGGTTAQADAGPLGGGAYGLQGGFWNLGSALVSVEPAPPAAPERFLVLAPAPNPFRDRTVVTFDLPREDRARVEVYSVTGQRLRTLLDGVRPAGRHQAWWDGADEGGRPVGPGVYFVRVAAGSGRTVRKLVRSE